MHFDCIRQTSSQTRQAGFDVTDHPFVPPILPVRWLVYRAFPQAEIFDTRLHVYKLDFDGKIHFASRILGG